ncbi:zinc finger MYND domain-containing protein [Phanerochaete sordida]|uniref:Zinc finger MYND domain-containing protein n=1 Tax=Phanerochaete sordida TaxID=48140 RepID=A0A9P3G995_9APHY|nr:zinc finger MYND domain-containing protein [Phanerochaete sordida]
MLRLHHPEFFDTCAKFITVPRTHEEHSSLLDEMAVCKCDMADGRIQALHDNDPSGPKPSYIATGWRFAHIIDSALRPVREDASLHKVEKNQRRAARRGTSVPWPRSPLDILPYGIDQSIAALAEWVEIFADSLYLSLFGTIMTLLKKAVVPPILASATLLGRFVEIAEDSLFALSGRDLDAMGGFSHALIRTWQTSQLFKILPHIFDEEETRELLKRSTEQVEDDHESRGLMSICVFAVTVLPDLMAAASDEETRGRLNDCLLSFHVAGILWIHRLELPHDAEKYTSRLVEAARKQQEAERDPVWAAYMQMLNFDHERCWAPGCRETFAGAQRVFAACSGCGKVTYCSKECLAKAWRHADVPHRAVCKKIKYILGETTAEEQLGSNAFVSFRIMCAVRQVERAVLQDFCDHMAKLKKYMSLVPIKREE